MIAYASEDGGQSLSDIVNGNGTVSDSSQSEQTNGNGNNSTPGSFAPSGKDFMETVKDGSDMSEEMPEIQPIVSGIKTIASYIIQILCYAVTVLLVLRVVLDLAYIGLPFCRALLANGYQGNPQAGAGGMPNSMMGGMGGMQPGMGGGMMGGGMGMNGGMGMGGGMYGRGGYGMNRMGGMGAMGGMQGGMSNPTMANSGGTVLGRVQWVSNAALNAVSAESTVGPDGKAVSPFKLYCKDMIVVLVLTPILLTLAVTGTLTNFGFLLGDLLVDAVTRMGEMFNS